MNNWARLGQAVISRRSHLGYTSRQQFQDDTGFPAKTLSDLEKHRRENFDDSTLGRLERALQWEPGTARAILDEQAVAQPSTELDPSSFLLSRTRERVQRLLDPDGPLDPQTRATVSAAISNILDLVEKPPPAAEELRGDETFEMFQATVAEHNRRQREELGTGERRDETARR
ncbi:hypothetical protein ACFFX1_55295 [Dactylosporangium sucinum]|uniref:Uncharacterized protein n=1 Tax=Dactylosporangium sucinum TaxID=1424081 RepID=A0A917U258_9ACTN|nr:hypothetical protein [Dactylosporangium sucinum]GGM52858.1 hypothetical protein GCM10007977_063050 [Dactylosporangium sucinum]